MCSTCITNESASHDSDATAPSPGAPARFALEGVSCGGCAAKITAAVTAIEGVTDAHVDVATATLDVTSTDVTGDLLAERVRTAVRAAGYGIN